MGTSKQERIKNTVKSARKLEIINHVKKEEEKNAMKIDLQKLQPFIEDKYISVQKHPTAELYIYNYTEKAQYDQVWTEETLMCRGLILDAEGNIVARPFKKFFNLAEHKGRLPDGKPMVWEKYDGSLGILYWLDGRPFLATRGSFTSDQAVEGTKMLRAYPETDLKSYFSPNLTYLFEIIYPENRIVVDYGTEKKLVHIATINNETGENMSLSESPFDIATIYPDLSLENMPARDNAEGYVLEWPDGLRLKVKHEEYVRLHRLVTQTTARSIWDVLKNQQPMSELLERVPDEFYVWVKQKSKEMSVKYEEIHRYASAKVKDAKRNLVIPNVLKSAETVSYDDLQKLTGKYKAALREIFMEKPEYEHICWAFYRNLDRVQLREAIFDTFYPPHETPFKNEV